MRIEARYVSVTYGEVAALQDLSVEARGDVIGILGPTASGKTSLLQVIAGLLRPASGEALLDGQAIEPVKRRDVSFVPQETGAFPFFQRPKQTMELSLELRGVEASAFPQQFLDALGLGDEDRSARGYSAGMKQKLRIAYAMLHTPRLLVLDEPMTGLDIRERFRVLRLLDRLRGLASILFSTHHAEEAAAICDQVPILARGRLVAAGTPAAITRQAEGHVFETSTEAQYLPHDPDWDVVSAERDEGELVLRVVGSEPPNGRPVPPRLTDAYVLLTRSAR